MKLLYQSKQKKEIFVREIEQQITSMNFYFHHLEIKMEFSILLVVLMEQKRFGKILTKLVELK